MTATKWTGATPPSNERHLCTAWVEYRDQSSFFSGDDYGAYFFTGQFTGNAFADFLLGLPSTTRYAQNPPDAEPYSTQFAGCIGLIGASPGI